jgi:hypothetical protein
MSTHNAINNIASITPDTPSLREALDNLIASAIELGKAQHTLATMQRTDKHHPHYRGKIDMLTRLVDDTASRLRDALDEEQP